MLECGYLDSNLSSCPYISSTFLADVSPQPTKASPPGSVSRQSSVSSGCLEVMGAGFSGCDITASINSGGIHDLACV